jgi:hypothetical protein
MAHFAELNENNIVTRVIVVSNNELLDDHGIEQESKGIQFCQQLLGGNWKQTSYNSTFRKHYAGIGYTYDQVLDAFISPKPYPSWLLNTETCDWESPVPYPTDGGQYTWDEASLSWILLTL